MAIKFDVDEKAKQQKILQDQENKLAKEENRKAKKIKVKGVTNPFGKWSDILFTLSMIAVVYSFSYVFSGFIIFIPTLILWTIWFVVVTLPSVLTLGAIWISAGFRSFVGGFTKFNTGVSQGSAVAVEFMYKIFPYVASFFTLCVIGFLILKIIGARKHIGKSYKGKLVGSIILTVIFIVAIIFDIVAFVNAI